jgi:protein TonB
MSVLRLVHRSLKGAGGALLCGFLGAFVIVAGVSAQEVRDTIGPVEKQAQSNPITPENPIPRRTFSVAPVYPAEANGIGAAGTVSLVAVVDEAGRVVEMRKPREPLILTPTPNSANETALRIAREAFVRDAAGALRRWTYDPPARGPIAFTVSFSFKPGAEATSSQSTTVTPPLTASATRTLASVAGGVEPLRVGNQIKAPTQIKKVQPNYPEVAQAARVQGIVILEATIGGDGRVIDAKVLRSVPLLDQAAIDAVRQWEYTPTLLNGVPVPIVMTVTVTFNLAPGVPPPPQ